MTTDVDIGKSRVMAAVMEQVQTAACNRFAVIIFGETGVGKGVVAKLIHKLSEAGRRDKPFITVNCTTITDSLIEFELFGAEKGSFTGANTTKRGPFEVAESGTVFLDEIGELTPAQQGKLLQVLEDKVVRRVGGVKDIEIHSRVIAATNRDIPAAIERREFREDLWYRLNVYGIYLPPLRERREDIPSMIDHALRIQNYSGAKVQRPCDPEVVDFLSCQHWPGNARQLINTVVKAVANCKNRNVEGFKTLTIGDFGFLEIESMTSQKKVTCDSRGISDYLAERETIVGSDVTLHELQRMHFEMVVNRVSSVEEAMKVLGLRSKQGVYNMLSRYEISVPWYRSLTSPGEKQKIATMMVQTNNNLELTSKNLRMPVEELKRKMQRYFPDWDKRQ